MHPSPLCRTEHWRFFGNSPKGCGRDAALCWRDRKSLPANPDKTARAQEASGIGRISFGYFSLSAQRKVSRPWVREPTFKQLRVSDTINNVVHPSIKLSATASCVALPPASMQSRTNGISQFHSWFYNLTTNGNLISHLGGRQIPK
jgi:hypothetical protein